MVTPEEIVKVLQRTQTPMSVTEIASALERDIRECDSILWDDPALFVWQPGHRWTLASARMLEPRAIAPDVPDVRADPISAADPRELRALTLASGIVIEVNRRPLDSDAFFTVRSAGNRITLTLNSMHELFTTMPMPFDDEEQQSSYKALCEALLSSWALYEDSVPGGPARRSLQDARLLWGRRVVEILREVDDGAAG